MVRQTVGDSLIIDHLEYHWYYYTRWRYCLQNIFSVSLTLLLKICLVDTPNCCFSGFANDRKSYSLQILSKWLQNIKKVLLALECVFWELQYLLKVQMVTIFVQNLFCSWRMFAFSIVLSPRDLIQDLCNREALQRPVSKYAAEYESVRLLRHVLNTS